MSSCNIPRYCGVYHLVQETNVYGHVSSAPSWLADVSLSSSSKLYDTASRTTLTQVFANPNKSASILQAKYNFPLYESCAVVSFRCYVGKRLIEGVVKEKEQAKAEYQAAVDRQETAGLLEQHTPDVFSSSIGNIPAGEIVTVEIVYIMELKHDAQADGLRFTIPTSIAPRYGDPEPSGFSGDKGAVDKGGMKISVQITMPGSIRTVQSPSHAISMHLGGHAEDAPDHDFNPKLALATLGQTSTELANDFVLIVKCHDILSMPRALLESHPTIQGSKALMVTLVPKFDLPQGPRPEIVLIVDRSGSMAGRIKPLKSSLGIILKSIPVGVKFNICSFGSGHSFLWNKSKSYTATSLAEAQRHVESMEADFGGTEILPPIRSTISERFKDMPLEIMVLTDGEVWKSDTLYEYIEKETAAGDVRLFTLGIGKDVSHALVEGMARVGRGFAQIVSDEKEGMEARVVRMLRGCLSQHVHDYRLDWGGRPRHGDAKNASNPQSPTSIMGRAVAEGKKRIKLFDTNTNADHPMSFTDIPELVIPSILQAPYKLPSLFPFSRTTVYVIFSNDVTLPSFVWLRGTTAAGDELEQEIPVQVVPEDGIVIHQLAARKILQELEEGTGYIHQGTCGVNKQENPGTFDEYVQREGVRIGVRYGLASKWTSFVAVQKKVVENASTGENADDGSVTEEGDGEDFEVIQDGYGQFATEQSQVLSNTGRVKSKTAGFDSGKSRSRILMNALNPCGSKEKVWHPYYLPLSPSVRLKRRSPMEEAEINKEAAQPPAQPLTPHERTKALIALQSFEGAFPLTEALAALLEVPFMDLEAKARSFRIGLSEGSTKDVWATVLAVTMFVGKLAAEKEVWELMVEKAKSWVAALDGLNDEGLKKLETLAREVCGS